MSIALVARPPLPASATGGTEDTGKPGRDSPQRYRGLRRLLNPREFGRSWRIRTAGQRIKRGTLRRRGLANRPALTRQRPPTIVDALRFSYVQPTDPLPVRAAPTTGADLNSIACVRSVRLPCRARASADSHSVSSANGSCFLPPTSLDAVFISCSLHPVGP